MAQESTPRTWPSESRGFADDALGALSGPFNALLDWMALHFGPLGRAVITLQQGQTALLEGMRLARVTCLEGHAWVTNPDIGRDVMLQDGEVVQSRGGASMAVTAVRGPARISLGWK